MSKPVYGQYDQVCLDAQYNNQTKVPGAEEIIRRWRASSSEVRKNSECRLNVSYGSSDAETLDIFKPKKANDAPIQVFFHGGYWKALYKDDFSYVANGFHSKGVISVVVNYALIPEVNMNELIRQCRASLTWTWNNAASFGGNRNRIYISGHSAGGHIAAMMMATDWPKLENLPKDLVKGACGISGLYDLEPIQLCFLNDDLKLSDQDVAHYSPVKLKRQATGSILLPVGDLEGPEYLRQSETLASVWQNTGLAPVVKVLSGQDHFSIADQLNDSDSELCSLIHAQMA